MSIENARKHLENAANSGRSDTKWGANIELCLDAIIDTLEMRDNRTSVPTPTVTPEQVVNAVRTPAEQLYADLMDPTVAKTGLEHFASRRIAKLEAENKRLRDSIEMLDTLPSPNTDRVAQLKAERDELAAALRVLLRDAVILSAEYLSTFDDWGPDHVIQGWEKSRWIRVRAAADQVRAALAKVGTMQKPKTFDSVVEMVRDLFPDDPGIVAELERRMQRTEDTDG